MALLLLHASTGLVVHSGGPSRTLATPRHAAAQCGLFDMFKESDASKAAKDEQWKIQQALRPVLHPGLHPTATLAPALTSVLTSSLTSVLTSGWLQEMAARRRNPAAMKEYEDDVAERRRANMKEGAELKALQNNEGGADTLEAWQQLQREGKAFVSDDMERDADSARLGSAGLIDARIDTNLPFIDQGYVSDDQPDLMGELGKL